MSYSITSEKAAPEKAIASLMDAAAKITYIKDREKELMKQSVELAVATMQECKDPNYEVVAELFGSANFDSQGNQTAQAISCKVTCFYQPPK